MPYYKYVIALSIYMVESTLQMWSSLVHIFGIVINIHLSLAHEDARLEHHTVTVTTSIVRMLSRMIMTCIFHVTYVLHM